MENKNFEQLINEAKKINLSPEERSAIERSVLNFIKENPVHAPAAVRPDGDKRLVYQNGVYSSFWSNVFLTKLNFSSVMAILLLLSVLVSGGVAVGAEKSLPGEVLYPVKLNINEEVRGWLAISEEAKAGWEIQRAHRRLEEAEELAAGGNLNAEVRENIEANFEDQSERIRERIEKFKSKENFNAAVDVSSKFETSLEAHERILNRLEAEEGASQELRPIRVRIKSQADKTRKNREEIELEAEGQLNVEVRDEDDDADDSNDELEIEGESRVESEENSVNAGLKVRANIGL